MTRKIGRTVHTALIVTANYASCEGFTDAWKFAQSLGLPNKEAKCYDHLLVTDVLDGWNGWSSFAVLPDGSNVGRERHENCRTMRDTLIERLKRVPGIHWVEVAFAEYSEGAYITRERV